VDADEERRDIATATAAIAAIADALRPGASDAPPDSEDLLDALVLVRWVQAELAVIEPVLVTAARAAGVSWQNLAPALGVASRQAAERRYLRSSLPVAGSAGTTRDARVQAERDRRAAHRAVVRWANDNTADLRRLAGQVVALTDLNDDAAESVDRLNAALGDPDAAALPDLLAGTQPHLDRHPALSAQIGAVTERAAQIRQQPDRQQHEPPAGEARGET
jgi:hypothetical protein